MNLISERARTRPPRGVSLVELLLAMFLATIVISGLAAVQGSFLGRQRRILQETVVRNQADLARKAILKELAEATLLESPRPGKSDNELSGWVNLDPSNIRCGPACAPYPLASGWNPLVDPDANGRSPADVRYFRLCLSEPQRQLHYYAGSCQWGRCAIPAGACGEPGGEVLAGEPAGSVRLDPPEGWGVFTRPPGHDNFVRVVFTVALRSGPGGTETALSEVDTGSSILVATR